jgi:hypothetical protein
MSIDALTNFRTEFESLVKHAYQGESKLMGKVRTRMNANAKTVRFPKLGKGIATERMPQTDVVPMNVDHSYVDCTIKDWIAADYSAIEDLSKLSFDEKAELVKIASKAVGRKLDQLVIDAMAASAFATQVAITVGGSNTSLNIEKIMRAKRLLDANGVPSDGRVILTNAIAMENALQETEIASSDFNVIKALASGELSKFAQFEFIMIEDRTEGGIPLATTNQRNCFAFHRDAVGLAMNGGIRSEVNYIPEKTSHLIASMFQGGAVTIDTDGVIDVLCYEA